MRSGAKRMLNWTGAALLGCSALQAGEQVQFKGSTSIELPKPKRPVDSDRRLRVEDERPNLEGGFVTPPAIENSPLSDKKTREALDKKKNWIYMNPYEKQFDSKTEQFLKGEKSSGLYENRWMKSEEEKTAVQKFMEERETRRKDENPRNEKDRDREELSDRQSGASEQSASGLPDDSNSRNEESNIPGPNLRSQVDFVGARGGSADPFGPGPLGNTGKNPLTENPFVTKKPTVSSFERDELKQQQIAHEKDFESILSTRLGTAGSAPVIGRLDSLTTSGANNSLDLGSSTMRRNDQGINFGRGSGVTTATFTDGGPGFNSGRSSFDARSFGDAFSSKAPNASSPFAPAASQVPAVQSPGFSPSAFSLPTPRRKF